MMCPVCRRLTLAPRTLREAPIRVDHCPECGGIWFDRGELERAIPEAVEHLHPPDEAPPVDRLCPKCVEPLVRFQYPQTYVQVDMCTKCRGLWLDVREYREIRAVRGHLRKTGRLEPDPVSGVKGALLDLIDQAISALM